MAGYPPEDHVLRDLRITSWLEDEGRAFAEMPVDHVVHDRSGVVSLGALGTLVDLVCARVAFGSAHPHWIATADLSLVTAGRPSSGTVVAEARLARSGSKLITLDVDLHGAGAAVATFVRIPREASEVDRPMPTVGERMQMPPTRPPLDVAVTERMGLVAGDGAAELARTDYVRNSFGTINGGVLGFLCAAAAEEVTDMVATDLTLRYLGQTKVGPARAVATVVRHGGEHAVCDVRVHDAGAGELLLARATVTVTA